MANDFSGDSNCVAVWRMNPGNELQPLIGYNGGASYQIIVLYDALTVGDWHHIGITYDASTKDQKKSQASTTNSSLK